MQDLPFSGPHLASRVSAPEQPVEDDSCASMTIQTDARSTTTSCMLGSYRTVIGRVWTGLRHEKEGSGVLHRGWMEKRGVAFERVSREKQPPASGPSAVTDCLAIEAV